MISFYSLSTHMLKKSIVRVPKPLSNLMKEGAGFKLSGPKELLESGRAVEIQKSIDTESRAVAAKALGHVLDFNIGTAERCH